MKRHVRDVVSIARSLRGTVKASVGELEKFLRVPIPQSGYAINVASISVARSKEQSNLDGPGPPCSSV